MGTIRPPAVTLGIVGLGNMAHRFAQAIPWVEGLHLQAVASRSKQKSEQFARQYQAATSFCDYDELIHNDRIALVYICTPPALHAELAKKCLSHGKSVLVEKPFTVNATEAKEVFELALQKRLFCMEAMWMRFLPAFQTLLDFEKDGDIRRSEIKYLSADFGVPASFAANSHHFDRLQGGAWLDRGIYGLSLANALLGVPESYLVDANIGPSGCDLQSTALLHFSNGAMATVSASFLAYTSNEAVVASGQKRFVLREPFIRPEQLSIRSYSEGSASPSIVSRSFKSRLLESQTVRRLKMLLPKRDAFVPFLGNGYVHEAVEAVRCLREGKLESEIMPWSETVQVMELSDSIRACWL